MIEIPGGKTTQLESGDKLEFAAGATLTVFPDWKSEPDAYELDDNTVVTIDDLTPQERINQQHKWRMLRGMQDDQSVEQQITAAESSGDNLSSGSPQVDMSAAISLSRKRIYGDNSENISAEFTRGIIVTVEGFVIRAFQNGKELKTASRGDNHIVFLNDGQLKITWRPGMKELYWVFE